MKSDTKGDWLVFGSIFLWVFFPITSKLSLNSLPPLLAYSLSTLFASLCFLFFIIKRHRFNELKQVAVIRDSFYTAIWIGVVFYGLYFYGLQFTTAGNASIVALSEVLWAYFFFNFFKGEPFSKRSIVGGIFMLLGAIIVLIPKAGHFQYGDIIILFATMAAPLGNHFQKRARKIASSESILFLRCIFTVVILSILSIIFGESATGKPLGTTLIVWLALNGIFLLGLSKILWLEGIFLISVTRANALQAITPLLTLIAAYFLLKEKITYIQLASLIPFMIGMLLLTTSLGIKRK